MTNKNKTYGEMTREELIKVIQERESFSNKCLKISDFDIKGKENYKKQIDKLKETIEQKKKAFKESLKDYNTYISNYKKKLNNIIKRENDYIKLKDNHDSVTNCLRDIAKDKI